MGPHVTSSSLPVKTKQLPLDFGVCHHKGIAALQRQSTSQCTRKAGNQTASRCSRKRLNASKEGFQGAPVSAPWSMSFMCASAPNPQSVTSQTTCKPQLSRCSPPAQASEQQWF